MLESPTNAASLQAVKEVATLNDPALPHYPTIIPYCTTTYCTLTILHTLLQYYRDEWARLLESPTNGAFLKAVKEARAIW